jgi:hypothetical protein
MIALLCLFLALLASPFKSKLVLPAAISTTRCAPGLCRKTKSMLNLPTSRQAESWGA